MEPLRRLFTVDEYETMGHSGVFAPGDRVELLEGEIYQMTPIHSPHAGCVNRLMQRLVLALAPERGMVTVQIPFNLSERSQPQPDLTVLRVRADHYGESHAAPADVLLVIEVADSTLRFDRKTKAPLYAREGVPELWIVDLNGGAVEIHRDPGPTGFATVRRAGPGERISPLAFPDVVVAVDEILGR